MGNPKIGGLGKLYGAVLSAPFKLANLPFKSYRQYYGTPKKGEKYIGNILQQQRVKKIVPLILRGLEISDNDKHFMNMFNDFLTSEGHEPIDQSDINMKCKNCDPYFYKTYSGEKYIKSEPKKKEEKEERPKNAMSFKFNNEIKPKNSTNSFEVKKTYYLTYLGKRNIKGQNEFLFRIRWLNDKDDFLIFRTDSIRPLGSYSLYEVLQDNSKNPLKKPISLGMATIKIE